MEKSWLGLAMIVRNSSKTIKTLLDSIEGVFDAITLVDTGSTDDTKRIVEDHFGLAPGSWGAYGIGYIGVGCIVARKLDRLVLQNFEWVDDFSAARQFSYEQCQAKWICYLDCDDDASDLKRKLRPTLERTEKNFPNVNCISIGYQYTTDGGMLQDKIFRVVKWDGGWRWNDPLHEHLDRIPGHGGRDISKYVDMLVKHQPAAQEKVNASFERNIRITERWYSDPATTPAKRALAAYYLAMYACEVNEHALARKYFRESVDGLGRTNLSCDSLCLWSRMEARLGNTEQAIALASEAIGKAPELPNGLAALGATLSLAGEHLRAAGVFDQLKLQPKPVVESQHDVIWLDGLVNVYAAEAYYRCGRIDDAIRALDAVPKDLINHPEIHAASQEVRTAIQKTEGYKRLHALWEYLIWDTEPLKARRLLEELCPAAISDSVQVKQLRLQAEKKMPHMQDWAAYQRTYAAIPDLPYHVPENHRAWTLQQGRARLVAQWAAAQAKEGAPIQVLAIGIQDGIIEGQMMENCPRIRLTACDVAPQASKGINELIERFPGRVKTHQVKEHHWDWFPVGSEFDAVILFEVLEHLPGRCGDLVALSDIRAHLKTGGKLFLSTPIAAHWVEPYLSDMKSPRPWWHVRAHNPSSLWKLFQEAGFTGSLVGLKEEGLFLATMEKALFCGEEISIYVYPLAAHGFDPFSLKEKHQGGSEEAVVHLSAALARKGCRVTVFTDPHSPKRKDQVFVYQGVQWKTHAEFAPEALEGTLLVWRAPVLAASFKAQNPRLRVLNWLHDAGYSAPAKSYDGADGTITLSKFHGEAIAKYDGYSGPFIQCANGIVPEEFPEPDESKRDPHAAIYASAPNRGLEFLLDCWPAIRAQVPDATLRIYYSWALTEQMMEKRPELKAELGPLLAKLRRKFEELKNYGVTYIGGVDHKTLNDAYRTSGVFTYPVGNSGFEEVSCISLMRAQASGCRPVVIPLGAVVETCQWGSAIEVGCSEGEYADLVAGAMKYPDLETRKKMRAWALETFSWDKAADQFLAASRANNERVTIYAGAFLRQFDHAGSADGKPLGGSETAVIAMADALTQAGKEVVVYCPLPDGKSRPWFHGRPSARWLDSSTFNPAGPHGTLLAWRCPALVPKLKGNGYPVILWLMDPHYRAAAYDYAEADDVVFLTEAHKDIIKREDGFDGGGSVVHVGLPELPTSGMFGLDRDPKAVMWATSPDRGLLQFLCETWPQVLKEVPDARLHIFYGLEPLEANGKAVLAHSIRSSIATYTEGEVVYHGGVPEAELNDWTHRCSILAYPCRDFEETQSISVCRAMAMGCYPVTNEAGCLTEVIDAGDGVYAPNEATYVEALVNVLKRPPTDGVRTEMMKRAKEKFSTEAMVEKMLKVIAEIGQ